MQIYVSEQLKTALIKNFGEGRVSANIERILRAYLANPKEEKKIRLMELNSELRRFNADFMEGGEIIFPVKEIPPTPPKEKDKILGMF